MCGITGLLAPGRNAQDLRAEAWRMAQQLTHRGPDDAGVWIDAGAGLALGFRRLAVVDLSPAGAQPMLSASGRYVMVFNGEVYNFMDLRRDLEAKCRFRGHSDTEVMLAAIEEWGLEAAIQEFVGMFAFALWDRSRRVLALVRDRVGIKPLYYGRQDGVLFFGSELKSLRASNAFRAEIDRQALALFLRYGYVPGPHSIYRGVRKLPPGSILRIHIGGADTAPSPYWSPQEVLARAAASPFAGTAREACDELETLLRESVRLRMIADVPLGAFLSGGIDSSTTVALMQARSSRPVRTFTIGFHDREHDEARSATAVAAHLGAEHTELYVTPQEARAVIPKLPRMFDEPFADSSQIPTYLVSSLARQSVTVSLSGDGGDELFGGYPRYRRADAFWKLARWLPGPVRRGASALLAAPGVAAYNRWLGWSDGWMGRYGRAGTVGEKAHKLAAALQARDRRELYRSFLSCWKERGELVPEQVDLNDMVPDFASSQAPSSFIEEMMLWDLAAYLPDDILTKVDRASMAVSLEVRVPLLDHRVVEFAARLPLAMKIHRNGAKWLLRQVLYRHVPRALIDRPKMGFSVPLDSWISGPLKAWAEDLLSEARLRNEGYLAPAPIRRTWAEHQTGGRRSAELMWNVLMFEAWLGEWGQPPGRVAAQPPRVEARPRTLS